MINLCHRKISELRSHLSTPVSYSLTSFNNINLYCLHRYRPTTLTSIFLFSILSYLSYISRQLYLIVFTQVHLAPASAFPHWVFYPVSLVQWPANLLVNRAKIDSTTIEILLRAKHFKLNIYRYIVFKLIVILLCKLLIKTSSNYVRWVRLIPSLPSTLILYTCFVYLLSFILSICLKHLNIPFSTLDNTSSFIPQRSLILN